MIISAGCFVFDRQLKHLLHGQKVALVRFPPLKRAVGLPVLLRSAFPSSSFLPVPSCPFLLARFFLPVSSCPFLLARFFLPVSSCPFLLARFFLPVPSCPFLLARSFLPVSSCPFLLARSFLLFARLQKTNAAVDSGLCSLYVRNEMKTTGNMHNTLSATADM